MPAPRSSSSRRPAGASATRRGSGAKTKSTSPPSDASSTTIAEQIVNTIIRQLDLVVISRDRIQQVLDEAAERGRVTRGDANELVLELVRRGRAQTDDVLSEMERLLGRGRGQLESAGKRARAAEPVDRFVRHADRARRTIGVGPSFPIIGYDELTAGQVVQRLKGLKPAELRSVRDYERRHANRKSVLDAVERALG